MHSIGYTFLCIVATPQLCITQCLECFFHKKCIPEGFQDFLHAYCSELQIVSPCQGQQPLSDLFILEMLEYLWPALATERKQD